MGAGGGTLFHVAWSLAFGHGGDEWWGGGGLGGGGGG